jgi:hypothetical protein
MREYKMLDEDQENMFRDNKQVFFIASKLIKLKSQLKLELALNLAQRSDIVYK